MEYLESTGSHKSNHLSTAMAEAASFSPLMLPNELCCQPERNIYNKPSLFSCYPVPHGPLLQIIIELKHYCRKIIKLIRTFEDNVDLKISD